MAVKRPDAREVNEEQLLHVAGDNGVMETTESTSQAASVRVTCPPCKVITKHFEGGLYVEIIVIVIEFV